MILIRSQDTFHKAQLLRLLVEILDESTLSQTLYFKGGTCASMVGILDRLSVDLDFDLKKGADEKKIRLLLLKIFKTLDLTLKYDNQRVLEFLLKYPSPPETRNTIKLNALPVFVKANKYAPYYLPEIDRTAVCQTKETMFANKLVAVVDRYEKHRTIAGRDIYDIHHFFLQGLRYEPKVIVERMQMPVVYYCKRLIDFIEQKVTEKVINEDLNTLLPDALFQRIRKTLKTETLMFLRQELQRLIK